MSGQNRQRLIGAFRVSGAVSPSGLLDVALQAAHRHDATRQEAEHDVIGTRDGCMHIDARCARAADVGAGDADTRCRHHSSQV